MRGPVEFAHGFQRRMAAAWVARRAGDKPDLRGGVGVTGASSGIKKRVTHIGLNSYKIYTDINFLFNIIM